jgi:signal transduction histidine kinase
VRLRQLLLNLGENAVEFTPAGGRIRIEAAGHDGTIVAKVSDTGAGISAELLPRVFDRHVHGQAQGAKARSGLGLAIVKRIVDAHGGTVVIQSQAGVGTTALITLPAAVPSA